jgi:thioester reductase-like protein
LPAAHFPSGIDELMDTAWNVNWNLDLAMMEPNVQGTRYLIDLALSSSLPSPPRFLFVSTVSVARRKSKFL